MYPRQTYLKQGLHEYLLRILKNLRLSEESKLLYLK